MAANVIKTTLSIGGENKYKNALKEISTSLKGLDSEMAVLNARFTQNGNSMAALTGKQDILKRKYDEQQKKLKRIAEEYRKVSSSEGENSEAARRLATDYNYASAALQRTENQINDLGGSVEDGTVRFTRFSTALRSLNINAESVGGALERMGDKVANVSAGLAAAVGTVSIKSWMNLEDEVANISTIADYSRISVDQLTDGIIKASNETGVVATDIASATYQAISAAVDTADATDLVTRAAKAAKAGVSDVTTVINGSTSIINGWKLQGEDANRVFDKLLKTQQLGKTSIGELSQTIGQVAGLAPQLNVSIDEVLATVGALTQSGYQTSSVMSGLKGVLSAILKPTSEAQEQAKALGLEFNSTALQAKGLTGFMADVQEKTKGDADALAKLFGSVEGLSAVMALGGNSAEAYNNILRALGDSAGTLETMFDQRTSSAAQRFAMSLNNLKNAGIELGRSMAPYIQLAADKLGDFTKWVQSLDTAQVKNILSTALWIAGISKGVAVLGKLIKTGAQIKTTITSIRALLSSAVTGPVGIAIASVAALTAGLYALYRVQRNGKLDLNVDTSDIDDYKIDSKTLEDPIQIIANAKLEIKTELGTVKDEIVKWLSDGIPETPEEQAAMAEKVNSAIGAAFDSVTDNYNTKKAALDELLAGGMIDQAKYDADLSELNTQTETLKSGLTEKAQAVTDYVATLVSSNRAITDDEIAKLGELLDALGETSGKVLEATNAQKAAYEWAYEKATAGVGSDEDFKTAMQYVEMQYSRNQQDYQSAVDAVHGKYASMEGDPVEKAKQEAAEIAALDAQMAQYNKDREGAYAQIFGGALKSTGLGTDEIESYLAALEKYNEGGMKLFGWTYGNWNNVTSALGTDNLSGQVEAMNKALADMDTQKIEEVAKTMAAQGIISADEIKTLPDIFATMLPALQEAAKNVPAGAAEGVNDKAGEFTDAVESMANGGSQIFATALEINSPSRKFYAYGVNIVDGLINGLSSREGALTAKAQRIAAIVEQATRKALQINSPSRKFREIGHYTADGMILGLNDRMNRVEAAYSRLGSTESVPRSTGTAAPEMHSGGGQTVYNNTINYTGAYSRREARKFSAFLAQEQKGAAVAEGL